MASPLIRTSLFFLCILSLCPLARATPRQQESDTRLPRLVITDIKTDNSHGRTVLSLSISQETRTPHPLEVPILIRTGVGDIRFDTTLFSSRNDLSFVLPDPPLAVILDPDQVVRRDLDPAEIPPTWSRFLEAGDKTIVLASDRAREIFAPLLDSLHGKNIRVIPAREIKNAELSKSTCLFLGADNAAARTLFAKPRSPSGGFTLDVRRNPLNQGSVAVLVSSSSRQETEAAVRQLPQYADSSFLHFKEGRLLEKRIIKGTQGQEYILEELPAGAPTTALSKFSAIIDRLAASRVVYVGETHTSVADHRLQFRIIQALYKKNPHLAIGMEMFPRGSQHALNAYISGDTDMDESSFLKKSRYFQVWGYDWRLFRDIFNFAHLNRIPVIGLNLDRRIVSHVFKSGSTDNLSPEEKQELPADRDLDLPGYTDRLKEMYATHHEKDGEGSISGFIQAQGLWDETMAQTIATYLAQNPAVHMVVLAGIEHIRKDRGIPPRVTRSLAVSQSSVINIHSENAPADGADMADFFFMEPSGTLPPAAKLGLVLEAITGDNPSLQITGLSPHGKAKEAGLREKDILLAIDGHPVYTMSDVRIAMIDTRQGDTVMVKIRRSSESQEKQEMEFSVIAQTLSREKPHP